MCKERVKKKLWNFTNFFKTKIILIPNVLAQFLQSMRQTLRGSLLIPKGNHLPNKTLEFFLGKASKKTYKLGLLA